MEGFTGIPGETQFAVKRVNLSKAEYLRLAQFINDSFQRVAHGRVNYLQPGFLPKQWFL
jgi:Protein of unknown function (DUF2459)